MPTSMTAKTTLPRVHDSWSFVYVESAHIEREAYALVCRTTKHTLRVPSAQFVAVLAGPGTTVTHAAATLMAERGCSLIWCGESAVRFYGQATPETHITPYLEQQAQAWAFPQARLEVARRMYRMRFPADDITGVTSIAQLRGREGARMRDIYAQLASQSGVDWQGRSYSGDDGLANQPIQQAISVANSCLYGVCHAAIVSIGMSPGLGFFHHGNQRSFVWDVADLYKAHLSLPIAFAAVAESSDSVATRVRRACRDAFFQDRILARIVPDIYALFELPLPTVRYIDLSRDSDAALLGEE
jgi:CRISPR-associated protein Cas1